ncbi:MAG: metalloregulator ArsR/SmtB family transcription factor [Anaerolineae bacterium]|nr:metalloregulator ArsR/SmtB family transcription factor [Anaerolineae bacterium]
MTIPAIEELNLMHERICQAVNDPKRLQIMYALDEQPRNVTALAQALNLPQSTVSRHLTVLRERSLVLAERDGTSVIYRLADRRLIEVMDVMRNVLHAIVVQQTIVLENGASAVDAL